MAVGNEYIALATSPTTTDEFEDLPPAVVYKKFPFDIKSTVSRPRYLFILLIPLLLIISFSFRPSRSNIIPEPIQPDENPYFWTGKIWDHNDEVAAMLDRCSALGLLRNTSSPLDPLSPEEESELIAQGCGTNQTTVIVLASMWFSEAYSGTSTAGETIYAQSVISTLNAYHYSYVFSCLGWYNPDMSKTIELWEKHALNARMILVSPVQVNECWNNGHCVKTADYPEGIPAWKMLSLWYWDDPGNPLGPQFTLSPSPRNPNHFLSFSIEPTCHRLPYLASHLRASPPQAYLLAKQVHYLDDTPEFSWTLPALAALKHKFGIQVVGGMQDDDEVTREAVKKTGLTNLGKLDKIEFYEQLATSFVLLGVGRPRISPSPWDALCMGVPFINPILSWDESDPTNRTKWHAQQWHMTDLDPPYVYSVQAHDLDALNQAVKAALDHPIDSYIPDYMRFDFVCERMAQVVEGDWKNVAEVLLEERTTSGDGALFII